MMSYGGAADLSFGTAGFHPLMPAANKETDTSSALQADGKVIVGGGTVVSTLSGEAQYQFTVSRYNADGSADASFGTGGTFTDPSLAFSSPVSLTSKVDSAEAVVIQPDGKIVVAGEVGLTAKVLRLLPDGTLDPSFGSGGIVTLGTQLGPEGELAFAEDVALLPGGKIAVGGFFQAAGFSEIPAVERLDADGSIDATFNNGGLALIPLPKNATAFPDLFPRNGSAANMFGTLPVLMVAQADGSIIVGASVTTTPVSTIPSLTEIVTTRFNTSGSLDSTYEDSNPNGNAGQSVLFPYAFPSGATTETLSTMALQADGKLVLAGTVTFGQPGSNGSFTLATVSRELTNGYGDTNFGILGRFVLTGPLATNAIPDAEAIQPDGKIVLGIGNDNFARLTAAGLPDVGFGLAGVSSPTPPVAPVSGGSIGGLLVQPDGKILAITGGTQGDLIRLLGNGATGDYDDDGRSDPSIYNTTNGQFTYYSTAKGTTTTIPFGIPGAGQTLPAPGAYDGGGVSELAVYLPAQGAFAHLLPGFGPGPITPFGSPGLGNSLPAPGDYDLSGKTELGVYLPKFGAFAYRPAAGGPDVIEPFGTPGAGKSIPVPADYFGTGQDDIAVYLPDLGAFAVRNPTTGRDQVDPFGTPGAGKSIPVPGDYDGSGKAEYAVYLPDLSVLIYRPANGGPDVIEQFGLKGAGMTLPAPGDYDGSGKTEVAAYLPSLGLFAFRPSNGGPDVLFPLGNGGSTVPFVLASATDTGAAAGSGFGIHAASVEIPLTPDVLDSLAGTVSIKKAARHG